ncbi:hypothetical protein SAMN05421692_3460 [Chryseobacterium indologenes]|nr:hypothetical protein SAMN05421692_3460 [Chryseobacterium indologenes]SUX51404.1 Uncharacterised protein [Chryseobacterium indologenes]VFA42261.1 Uncharacterised protein [Chryseobacterium indologenes]
MPFPDPEKYNAQKNIKKESRKFPAFIVMVMG